MKLTTFNVTPHIPPKLQPLQELAMNMWSTWNWNAIELFIRLDPIKWVEANQSMIRLLGMMDNEQLTELEQDKSFLANMNKVYREFQEYLESESWHSSKHKHKGQIAYFCCEYGINESLPIYSGGLGVLAGDHLKSASDLGIPMVAVGLMYRQGYFRQRLNIDGWQQELYPETDWYDLPVSQVMDKDGSPLSVTMHILGEVVIIQCWRVQVGRISLYLLDTNTPANKPEYRLITYQLYGGDRENRLRQELILGIGGVRMLDKMGIDPAVYHINEGHSAFLLFERMRNLMKNKSLSFDESKEMIRSTTVFTTHTPVPAGNERFDHHLMDRYFSSKVNNLGISWDTFLEFGHEPDPERHNSFCMTVFAIKFSTHRNGVSDLHGQISRKLWSFLWPELPVDEVPIQSITNGIHTRSWMSHDLQDLCRLYIGEGFIKEPENQKLWNKIYNIPSSELWRTHQHRKMKLINFLRERAVKQLERENAPKYEISHASSILNPDALTIGFARRFATYKRGALLFNNPERLLKLIRDSKRPVQFIFAGKAHPQDNPGKEVIQKIIHYSHTEEFRNHIIFVEDYDINVARYLVQGVDIWLNTPRRPMEASGTSGMKAAANGVLNLSIADGWWEEGYDKDTGWVIGRDESYESTELQDQVECEALYNILENDVLEIFYNLDRNGLPLGWLNMMKATIVKNASYFNTHRMLINYHNQYYRNAMNSHELLTKNNHAELKNLIEWYGNMEHNWSKIFFTTVPSGVNINIKRGNKMPGEIAINLGPFTPEDVKVEVFYGPLDAYGSLYNGISLPMHLIEKMDEGSYKFGTSIPCIKCGRYGYSVRVIPHNKNMSEKFIPNKILWL